MANPFSNRKKVRGWKRRVRQLERFREAHRTLDVQALRESQYDYVKIWLDPWSRLEPRNPPVWFRRRILAALIDIHDAWREKLEALGEPYYLEIWLFDPDFHRSQVVAGLDWRMEHYRTVFAPSPNVPPRPPAAYDDPAYDLDRFQWRPGKEVNAYLATEYMGFEEAAYLARTCTRMETASTGEPMFVFELGNVWQGSVPEPSSS